MAQSRSKAHRDSPDCRGTEGRHAAIVTDACMEGASQTWRGKVVMIAVVVVMVGWGGGESGVGWLDQGVQFAGWKWLQADPLSQCLQLKSQIHSAESLAVRLGWGGIE